MWYLGGVGDHGASEGATVVKIKKVLDTTNAIPETTPQTTYHQTTYHRRQTTDAKPDTTPRASYHKRHTIDTTPQTPH